MTIDNVVNNQRKGYRKGCIDMFDVIEFGTRSCFVLGYAIVLGVGAYGSYVGICALNKYRNEPVVRQVNVISGPEAELFIEKDGKRFYAEIDGKPVSEYIKGQK